jgi:hypothetical protein
MSIPVIINNCNLLSYPKQMIEHIGKFDNVGDIIIVDNSSTYEPLLEWYLTKPCKIITVSASFHLSPWLLKLPETLGSEFYVTSDPDLDLSSTPRDTLLFLKEKMLKYKEYDKIGLGIKNWNVSTESPYHKFLQEWAGLTWSEGSIKDGLLTAHQIDTTFAMYNLNRDPRGSSCATFNPYSVNHIPWDFTSSYLNNLKELNYEFYYYLCNANKSVYSSTYKSFINFQSEE